ncbi:MAG: AtpZ/AtpI family protein [Oscillospiraceae bacterium]|nr:AtpZ/AtpI family protein [Oscillospiraceae bacterium]
MSGGKKDNPFSAYVVTGHIAFTVAAPLLFFIGGGTWLANKMDWPDWTGLVFVLLGVSAMTASLITYFRKLIKMYDNPENKEEPALKPSQKENDYYYDNEKNQ